MCFHVTGAFANYLIDCGASSLIGLKARQVELNKIRAIFFTHFHANHSGRIPFFIRDAEFFSKRMEPLALVGPKGLSVWYERTLDLVSRRRRRS